MSILDTATVEYVPSYLHRLLVSSALLNEQELEDGFDSPLGSPVLCEETLGENLGETLTTVALSETSLGKATANMQQLAAVTSHAPPRDVATPSIGDPALEGTE